MTSRPLILPSPVGLIWGFLLGLCIPYLTILLHVSLSLPDWASFDSDTTKRIATFAPLALPFAVLLLMLKSALQNSSDTASKSINGFIALLLGIGCIGLGVFIAMRIGFLPSAPSFV